MTLEEKRMKVELMRVTTARMELEYKIEEKKEEIKRLEDHIKLQLVKEDELSTKLKTVEG